MSSPIQNKALPDVYNGFEICTSDDLTVKEIQEMLGGTAKTRDARIANDANNRISTNTNTNDMDSAEVMNKAANSEDDTEVILTVINGKLHYWEPSGRFRPVEATPEELKQWVKDECWDTRKKDEWIKWLMEAPLDPSQFGGACKAPYNDIASPEELKSAVERPCNDLNRMYADMERFKAERNKKLDEALQLDLDYRSAKRNVEWYTVVIMRSLEKDGET
jgi:hypothetical protein